MMKENKQLLVIIHLSQFLDFITGIGGFVVPLIIWLLKKDEIHELDYHGKTILNFRISMFIYTLICIPFIFLFGVGILGFIVLGCIYLIFPIVNAVRASNNQIPHYPLSIKFIK